MPVSSPYAVFRAADLNWPPRSPLVVPAAPARGHAASVERTRRSKGTSPGGATGSGQGSACIQGDLFALSLCC